MQCSRNKEFVYNNYNKDENCQELVYVPIVHHILKIDQNLLLQISAILISRWPPYYNECLIDNYR